MGTAHHIISKNTSEICKQIGLNEDAINEILRLKMLEHRRIQQVNTLRRVAQSKCYARD